VQAYDRSSAIDRINTQMNRGNGMAQTYQPDDRVVVVDGPDAGRAGTVVDNYEGVYGDDITDGALVRFDDRKPSNEPVAGQGVEREFRSNRLRPA
jgi:ribosomal protein L24